MKFILRSYIFSLGFLLGLSLILVFITSHYILTVKFFDNSGEYLTGDPENESLVYHTLQKYLYLAVITYTVIKVSVIALIIYTALYVARHEIRYSQALNIVIRAEFILLLSAAAKVAWFKLQYPQGTLSDWHSLYIFSALSLTGKASADWYLLLQTLNLFEIAYWFILAYGIYRATGLAYDSALRVVVSSYVPALFVWVVAITFCTVLLFPLNA